MPTITYPIMIKRMQGLTLIELMITVSIAAILAGLAAPSFHSMMLNQRIRSASSDLAMDLTLARSEAIKQNGSISMSSTSGTTAWQNGWGITDASSNVIKTQGAYTSLTITATTNNVVYNRSGRSAGAEASFEVTAASSGDSVQPRCITVSLTGQPAVKKGSC